MKDPCPKCGSYPVKTDARPLKPSVPFSTAIKVGDRIEALPPFEGRRLYTSSNYKRDDQITISAVDPRSRHTLRMTALRFAACVRFGRILPSTTGVFPRDGNRNNFDPANTFIFPMKNLHAVRAKLGLGFKRECDWCGEEFIAPKPNGVLCSTDCRKQMNAEIEKDKRRVRKEEAANELARRKKESQLALAEGCKALP